MNRPARLTLLLLVCAFAPLLYAADWKKAFTSDAELPSELKDNVDVVVMPKLRTFRNPLNFPPYRVASYHHRWTRTSGGGNGITDGNRSLTFGSSESRRKFEFALEQNGTKLPAQCATTWGSSGATYSGKTNTIEAQTSASSALQCAIGDSWALTVDAQAQRGSAASTGRLAGNGSDIDISYLYALKDAKMIGDVPAGFLFSIGGAPVAALQNAPGGAPRRLTMKLSLTPEQKSAIAAATAALVLANEE